jgi:serine/threonine protein phosphatase PrpC
MTEKNVARIQVIEGLSLPGSVERENEDALGASASIAFVLDGVTGLADTPVMPGKSDAAWVAHAARDALLKHERASDVRALITDVATTITKRFEAERLRVPAARYEMPWTTLSLIAVEPGQMHIAFVGDSRVLIETSDDEVHNFGIHPSRTEFESKLAAKMLAARKGQALGVESIRATVLPDLRRARDTVNMPNGFWLLGADAAVGANAKVTSLALEGPATVLLATDGFYALVEDYRRYGDRELIATAQTLGLAILGRELRHIEDDDPDGEQYPRMKKSDDATALLVRVEP